MYVYIYSDFPGGSEGKSVCLQCRRPGFDPWVGIAGMIFALYYLGGQGLNSVLALRPTTLQNFIPNWTLLNSAFGNFPDGPVGKTLCPQFRGPKFNK